MRQQQLNEAIASKLSRLAVDLRRLSEPGFLESLVPETSASDWYVAPHTNLHLCGNVTGHPTLTDGPFESSELWYLDHDLKLARTLSRWYRLEAPLAGGRRGDA